MTRRIVLLLGAGALCAACGGGAHLGEQYGRSVRAATAAQRLAGEPAKAAPSGLDSEEAAIIHSRYRTSLGAPKPAANEDLGGRVLVVEEPQKNAPRR